VALRDKYVPSTIAVAAGRVIVARRAVLGLGAGRAARPRKMRRFRLGAGPLIGAGPVEMQSQSTNVSAVFFLIRVQAALAASMVSSKPVFE
jgi:hypothetical protein